MKTKELSRVSEFFRAVEVRRSGLAETYRSELLADLAARGSNRTAAELALVDIAVSSRLAVTELTARYAKGRCSDQDLVHLTHARATLMRALKALGLVATGCQSDADAADGVDLAAEMKRVEAVIIARRPAGSEGTDAA